LTLCLSAEIVEFCQKNHGVTFPLTEKVDVNGDDTTDVYQYLKSKKSQLGMSRIKWNVRRMAFGPLENVLKMSLSLSLSLF